MQTVEELLSECGRLHGHLCAGQLLGVRMAMLGCRLLGIEEPKEVDRMSLIVWVEIDDCVADAVSVVTGVRLGKRSLKFFDYGKVAATFLNSLTVEAVRIVALDESRALADLRYPLIKERKERQFRAYSEALDEELFKVERVQVKYTEMDAPGRPRSRVSCSMCGEGINDGREVLVQGGVPVCRPCSGESYYQRLLV